MAKLSEMKPGQEYTYGGDSRTVVGFKKNGNIAAERENGTLGTWNEEGVLDWTLVEPRKPDESLKYRFIDSEGAERMTQYIDTAASKTRLPFTAIAAFKKLKTGEWIPVDFDQFVVYADGSIKFVDELEED